MYRGPLRDEPPAVELLNTVYAEDGAVVDGLATDARAWLGAMSRRAGVPLRAPAAELTVLRDAVRAVLRAGGRPPARAVAVLNAATRAAPAAPVLVRGELAFDHGDATPGQVTLAFFAADALRLRAGGAALHACRAPGCVLHFVGADPRRRWCSPACGNRARQARHYARQR